MDQCIQVTLECCIHRVILALLLFLLLFCEVFILITLFGLLLRELDLKGCDEAFDLRFSGLVGSPTDLVELADAPSSSPGLCIHRFALDCKLGLHISLVTRNGNLAKLVEALDVGFESRNRYPVDLSRNFALTRTVSRQILDPVVLT